MFAALLFAVSIHWGQLTLPTPPAPAATVTAAGPTPAVARTVEHPARATAPERRAGGGAGEQVPNPAPPAPSTPAAPAPASPPPYSTPGVYCPVPGEPGMPSDDPACR